MPTSLALKGIKNVVEGSFTAQNGYIYFVRYSSNSGKTDGYVQFNGKKYGTADELAKDVEGIVGDIPSGQTIQQYVQSQISGATENSVQSTTIKNIVSMTQSQYDSLSAKDEYTLYVIKESNS